MAEAQAPDAVETPTTSSRKKTEYITVEMTDGRKEDFATTIKAKKTVLGADGAVTAEADKAAGIRFDFVNGQTRTVMLDDLKTELVMRLAAHGLSQKGGDSYASEKDVDDAVEALDDTVKTLSEGKWSEGRTGGGFAGVSILARALAEHYGRDIEDVRTILKDMTPKEKAQMRQVEGVREIVQRMETEKAKASGIDPNELASRFAA